MKNNKKKKIKEIKIGDEVITINPKNLKWSYATVINHFIRLTDKKIIKIITKYNDSLICTIDHLLLTSSGWRLANDAPDVYIFTY